MEELVWCAVNVSEGKQPELTKEVSELIHQFSGVSLKHIDIGESVNRSVITFFAKPSVLTDFSLHFFDLFLTRIDMRFHQGSHPRIGAVDVFPIVPLNGTPQRKCLQLAREIGEKVSLQFKLPVYLYEDSQEKKHRKRLEQIRKGGYESLEEKMKLIAWQPDFGPKEFQPKSGATVLGVRKALIAINFSLKNLPESKAEEIAKKIRWSNLNSTFRLKSVKAIGWFIPEYGLSQVSVNLTDFEATSLKKVFDAINHLAKAEGSEINNTELIGLLPKQALLDEFATIEEAVKYLKLGYDLNDNLYNRIFDMANASL